MHNIKSKDLEKVVRDEISKIYPQLKINSRNVCGDNWRKWADDLLHLSIEFFLEKPLKDQIYTLHIGKLEHFITNIANRQLKLGQTTRFWHTHRKYTYKSREYFSNIDYEVDDFYKKPFEDEVTDLMSCIKSQINDLDPYQKMLIKEKVEYGNTYRDIAKKYNIPYFSLQTELKKVLKNIKQKCKHLR